MAVSALATGYYGAWFARRVRPCSREEIVLVIAWFMTGFFFGSFMRNLFIGESNVRRQFRRFVNQ